MYRQRYRGFESHPLRGRGPEAADLLQALNTDHGGSLTTIHANNATSALSRLASCAMQAGHLPWEVVCRSVVDGISLVLHMSRIEGRRAVEEGLYVRGGRTTDNAGLTDDAYKDGSPLGPPAPLSQSRQAASTSSSVPF